MIAEEILSKIDATLEQLIRNANTFSDADESDLSETELDAFQKTQESLLQHLLHMDRLFEEKRKSNPLRDNKSVSDQLLEKYQRLEQLKTSINNTFQKREKKIPIFTKRKKKCLIQNLTSCRSSASKLRFCGRISSSRSLQ